MEIFVGNLSFASTEADIKKLFEVFGDVSSVVILRRKEKKEAKSRGFGFVGMPDEQQALAAIAGTNGKEFMGRALRVEPARPKVEAKAEIKPKKKREPKVVPEAKQHPPYYPVFHKPRAFRDKNVRDKSGSRQRLLDGREKAHRPNGGAGTSPFGADRRVRHFEQPRPGSFKGGRRSLNYMKRKGPAAVEQETNPRQRNQENPMRWRKRADRARPWQKSTGEHKPGEKIYGQFKRWKKTKGQAKPWKKAKGRSRPEKKRGIASLKP